MNQTQETTRLKNLLVKSKKENKNLKEELAQMTQFHDWDKVAALKLMEANEEIEILKKAAETYEDLLAGEKGFIDKNNELKEENEKLKLDFQNYKFDANKKHDDLMILNQKMFASVGLMVKNKALLKKIAAQDKKVEELESELLDSRESFNLQHQSKNFYLHGHEYTDEETGETFTRQDLWDLRADAYKFKKEIEELKKEITDGLTLKKITDTWQFCYGENMNEEYSGFIEKLKEEIEELKKCIDYDEDECEIVRKDFINELKEENEKLKEEACKKEEGTQAIIIKLKEEIDKMRKTLYKIQGR